jgi:hypothetical protein
VFSLFDGKPQNKNKATKAYNTPSHQMPPQINETSSFCFSDTKDDLSEFLMKNTALDSSIDTASTCSTDIETSLSKESLSSECLDSPCSLQHRGAVFTYEFDEESSEDCSRDGKGHPFRHNAKYNHKGFRGRLPLQRKLLLLAIFVFSVGAFVIMPTLGRASEYLKWRRFLEKDSPRILKAIRREPTGTTFTIRVKGSRVDLLKQSLDAHSRCSSVDEIQIEFDGNDPFPQVLFQYGAGKATQSGALTTAGVFLLNEGITFSCEDLDNAFGTWKKDPRRFVGFLDFQPSHPSSADAISTVPPLGTYSVLSDRAAFIHSHYLEVFSPFAKGLCCEDLLSMQVSLASKKPPVLMKADPREIVVPAQPSSLQTDPLSTQHSSCSTQCASYLTGFGASLLTLPNGDAAVLLGSA